MLLEGRTNRPYVTMDGLKMPFADDWHEARIGAIRDVRADEDGIGEPHRRGRARVQSHSAGGCIRRRRTGVSSGRESRWAIADGA